jgi:hypothetical protein
MRIPWPKPQVRGRFRMIGNCGCNAVPSQNNIALTGMRSNCVGICQSRINCVRRVKLRIIPFHIYPPSQTQTFPTRLFRNRWNGILAQVTALSSPITTFPLWNKTAMVYYAFEATIYIGSEIPSPQTVPDLLFSPFDPRPAMSGSCITVVRVPVVSGATAKVSLRP